MLKLGHYSLFAGCGSAAGRGSSNPLVKWNPFTPPAPPTHRFLKLYGRRFSKEDHILFIKLLYELVTLPELEPHMVQSYARLLIQLLK